MFKIPGNFQAILQPKTNFIPQDSLNKISNDAEANNLSALLVVYWGELIFEYYWQGFTADSTFNFVFVSQTLVGDWQNSKYYL